MADVDPPLWNVCLFSSPPCLCHILSHIFHTVSKQIWVEGGGRILVPTETPRGTLLKKQLCDLHQESELGADAVDSFVRSSIASECIFLCCGENLSPPSSSANDDNRNVGGQNSPASSAPSHGRLNGTLQYVVNRNEGFRLPDRSLNVSE